VVMVWHNNSMLVLMSVAALLWVCLLLGWIMFSSSHIHRLFVFNQPHRPTQPGQPSRSGRMSTGGGHSHYYGRNGMFYDIVGPVSRTASVLALRVMNTGLIG